MELVKLINDLISTAVCVTNANDSNQASEYAKYLVESFRRKCRTMSLKEVLDELTEAYKSGGLICEHLHDVLSLTAHAIKDEQKANSYDSGY